MTTSHGPDEAEMHAHTALLLVDGAQTRKTAGQSAPVRSVPLGLQPAEHVISGIMADSPLNRDPTIPRDLSFAAAMTVERE